MPSDPDPPSNPLGSPISDGHGTQTGGRDGHGTQTGGRIMPVLPIAPFILDGLKDTQVKAIKLRTLRYSQEVCASAAAAYKDIIAIIDV